MSIYLYVRVNGCMYEWVYVQVYCAPTGGGKTLICELTMLVTAAVRHKKSIFVLPYVSLVKEKERHMKQLVRIYNRLRDKGDRCRVKGYYGEKGSYDCSRHDIIICTIGN